MVDGRHAGQPLRYDRFEIVPATGGAELVHTAGQRLRLPGRIVGPASARFAGLGMLYAAHRIGMEIADRQPE